MSARSSRSRTPHRARLLLLAASLTACTHLRQEELRFQNGDVTLVGTLIMPASGAPGPAIVLIHGDGPDTREGYRFFAELFARNGVAALIYDKRGTGGSGGDWRRARFQDLADDALAGLERLKGHPGIDPRRIGLWGGSQGGWIAPLAASRSTGVAFVIVKAGPALRPSQLALHTSLTRVRDAGYPPEVLDRVTALMRLQFRILRSGHGWDVLAAEVEKVEAEPWYRHVAVMRHSRWQSAWMGYGADIDFEPLPILESLDMPVLFLLGERDTQVPTPANLAALDRIRRAHKNLTVSVFTAASHDLELPRVLRFRPRFAAGYLDTMIGWTLRQTKDARPRGSSAPAAPQTPPLR